MIDASILLYPIYGGVLMRSKRIPAEEQYRLIMECRQSGQTISFFGIAGPCGKAEGYLPAGVVGGIG